jgi:hypothetical protein
MAGKWLEPENVSLKVVKVEYLIIKWDPQKFIFFLSKFAENVEQQQHH